MLNPSGERGSAEDVTEAQKKAAVDAALDVKAKEVKAMTPTDVEARLSARGLSTHGNKKELIGRLRASKMNAFAKRTLAITPPRSSRVPRPTALGVPCPLRP